jgi:hypothetical protein
MCPTHLYIIKFYFYFKKNKNKNNIIMLFFFFFFNGLWGDQDNRLAWGGRLIRPTGCYSHPLGLVGGGRSHPHGPWGWPTLGGGSATPKSQTKIFIYFLYNGGSPTLRGGRSTPWELGPNYPQGPPFSLNGHFLGQYLFIWPEIIIIF